MDEKIIVGARIQGMHYLYVIRRYPIGKAGMDFLEGVKDMDLYPPCNNLRDNMLNGKAIKRKGYESSILT